MRKGCSLCSFLQRRYRVASTRPGVAHGSAANSAKWDDAPPLHLESMPPEPLYIEIDEGPIELV